MVSLQIIELKGVRYFGIILVFNDFKIYAEAKPHHAAWPEAIFSVGSPKKERHVARGVFSLVML